MWSRDMNKFWDIVLKKEFLGFLLGGSILLLAHNGFAITIWAIFVLVAGFPLINRYGK